MILLVPAQSPAIPKRRRGRPFLPVAERRDQVLQVLCTAEEKRAWEARAKRVGISASEWARGRLNAAARGRSVG